MTKTILTLEDLVKFCQENKLQSFSSSTTGYKLAVKVPATFEAEDSDDTHRGLMRLKFKLFHTLLNRNGSFVSEEAADEAMKTIPERPILAAIHQLDDGTWDFEGHEMEYVENEDGDIEIHYIESQVGSFSSEPAWKEYDEEADKTYICCYGYIPIDYTKAAEIIERKNGTKNSVELCIDEMSYNAKEKYLDLTKFYVNGSTLLGSEADGTEIQEGMLGARADIVDFSEQNNSVQFEQSDKLVKAVANLQKVLNDLNINDSLGKEVEEVKKKEFEQVQDQELEQNYDLTDGGTADTDGDADADGDAAGDSDESADADADADGETPGETADDGAKGGDQSGDDEPEAKIDDDETAESKKIAYTVNFDGITKEFGLSVSEKMSAIYNLVYATYGDEDWWDVDLFEEDGYIQMYGWLTNSNYRQKYEFDGENYTLVGDRVEVFQIFVTAEQKAEIEAQKVEFEAAKEKLRKYEEEPDKIEILESEEYSKIFGTKEYEALKEQKNHFDLSIDEVRTQADAILLNYAKHGNFSLLSEKETQAEHYKGISVYKKPVGRYGNLFANTSEK